MTHAQIFFSFLAKQARIIKKKIKFLIVDDGMGEKKFHHNYFHSIEFNIQSEALKPLPPHIQFSALRILRRWQSG